MMSRSEEVGWKLKLGLAGSQKWNNASSAYPEMGDMQCLLY